MYLCPDWRENDTRNVECLPLITSVRYSSHFRVRQEREVVILWLMVVMYCMADCISMVGFSTPEATAFVFGSGFKAVHHLMIIIHALVIFFPTTCDSGYGVDRSMRFMSLSLQQVSAPLVVRSLACLWSSDQIEGNLSHSYPSCQVMLHCISFRLNDNASFHHISL